MFMASSEALRRRAVAEEADRDVVLAQKLAENAAPVAIPHGAADDRIGAEISVGLIGDVH